MVGPSLVTVFNGATLEAWEGGSLLQFSPSTLSASIILETAKDLRASSMPSSGVAFDVKITHPANIVPTPREGVLKHGQHQVEVTFKLTELNSLDLAALTTTPMRVMITATCSDPLATEKMKLVCDSVSVQQCAVSVQQCAASELRREQMQSANQQQQRQQQPLARSSSSRQSSRSSTPSAPALHKDAAETLQSPYFTVSCILHELRVPLALSSKLFPTGTVCCVQYKRGAVGGNTSWQPTESDGAPCAADPASTVCCRFNGEAILIPHCQPSTDGKRVLLSLGLTSSTGGEPSTLRGVLKLDATHARVMEAGDTTFPLQIDGGSGATLVATLTMATDPRNNGAANGAQSLNSAMAPSTPPPVPRAMVLTPPPAQMIPATAAASPVSMLLTPPPAGTNGITRSATASSLVNVRSQLESLELLRGAGGGGLSPSALSSPSSGVTESSPANPLNSSMRLATPTNAGEVSTNPLRSFERQMPKSSNVQVAVRIRPRLSFESDYKASEAWTHSDNSITSTANDRQYQFDYVFAPHISTRKVFDTLCPSLIENALFGVNGTIFMYGQTASGKTHTMFGNDEEMGITPLVLGALFRDIEAQRKEHRGMEAVVTASYFEIYNEELNDLLDVAKKNLQVRSSGDGGFTVDVSGVVVRTVDEAMQVLVHGSFNKKMGQSHLNDRSSRSHSIFKIVVEVTGIELTSGAEQLSSSSNGNGSGSGNGNNKTRTKSQKTTAELCLVDLAGSETLQEKSGTSQRKETTNINLSLTYLKKVIWELAHKERHVSYRNSALTKVLKQAVGGNSRTCVVCCITASPEHFRDSRNTLTFGTTAKSVITTTKVNTTASVAADAAEVKRLHTELQRLHTIIEAYESTVQAYVVMEDDFRKVLDENGAMASRIDALEVEHAELESRASAVPSTTGAAASPQDAANDTTAAPVKRFTLPSATLRANAEEHAALLEEAISRLNEVAVSEPAASTPGEPQTPSYVEGHLEDDDMFDEVEDQSMDTRRASEGYLLLTPNSRPAPPRVRPPPTKMRHAAGSSGAAAAGRPVTAPRTVESLQLQLIQQTIDHRQELLKKDQEIERVHAMQVRPSDEIPDIMKKEEKVCVLLDQLHSFLHHGTPMRLVYTGDTQMSSTVDASWSGAGLPRAAPRIARVFMYLYTYHQKETFLCFCLVDSDGKLPKRSSCFEKILVKDIKKIELGQYSESFDKLKLWSASNPPTAANSPGDGTAASSPLEAHKELCKGTLDRRRMSFTVVVKKGKQYECVCEDEADFEAWVIELNRLLGTSAEWKLPLDISKMEFFDVLEEPERQFCSTMHIHPDEYMRAKQKMLRRKEKFVTLFDVRALAQFDLYHSQRFFYFLRCQGWVSQAALFYLTDKFVESAQPNLDDL